MPCERPRGRRGFGRRAWPNTWRRRRLRRLDQRTSRRKTGNRAARKTFAPADAVKGWAPEIARGRQMSTLGVDLLTSDAPPVTGLALQVIDLRVDYGPKRAVDGVSLEINEGEIFGLLGPNGAGKTSTLSAIEGLLEPASGSIRIR